MERVINQLIKNKIIEKEDADLYRYGFRHLFIILAHILTYAFFAVLFQQLGFLVVFLLCFIPLRSYAGGYHASSQLACFLASAATVFGVLVILKYAVLHVLAYSVLATFSYVVILVLAPRESKNKPYEDGDQAFFRKRSLLIAKVEGFIAIVLVWLGSIKLFGCVSLALFLIAFLLLIDWMGDSFQTGLSKRKKGI